MKRLFFVAMCAISVVCCTNKNITTITINLNKCKEIQISELGQKRENIIIPSEIPLEIVHNIYKADDNYLLEVGAESHIYLLDTKNSIAKQLMLEQFAETHNLSNAVLQGAKVSIDNINKNILAWYGDYVLKYDFNGKYIGSVKSDIKSYCIPLVLNNKIKLFQAPLAFTDIADLGNNYSLHNAYSDTIYSINKVDGTQTIKFIFDFGKYSYSEDIMQMTFNERESYISKNQSSAGGIIKYAEREGSLLAQFRYNNSLQTLFYKTDSKSSVVGNIVDDIYGGCNVDIVGSTPNSFILLLTDSNRKRVIVEI